MSIKHILLLCFITGLVFLKSLFGDFIGDDVFVIENNSFYTEISNLKNLFTKAYFLNPDDSIGSGTQSVNSSGSVAYRPVLSLTYFFDYAVWKLNPFGYRLTNLLLHLGCVLLSYFIFTFIFSNSRSALFSSMIFAVHPFVVDAVCSIGFRGDLVATLFVCAAFLAYLHKKFIISLVFFFLSLFAKESAIVLPFFIVAYDYFTSNKKNIFSKVNIGFAGIAVFYLFVYFFIFPNTILERASLMYGDLTNHIKAAIFIFSYYITGFINPSYVKVLPPVTPPAMSDIVSVGFSWSVIAVAGTLLVFLISIFKNKQSAFFLFWFLTALLPVSNIIPLINPIANRYMYLPLIGLAGFSYSLIEFLPRAKSLDIRGIVKVSVVIFCMLFTVPLSMAYRNDNVFAMTMLKYNPENPMGYMYMALNYSEQRDYDNAYNMAIQAKEKGVQDPRVDYVLGKYYIDDIDKQKEIFYDTVKKFPRYVVGYVALGRAYLSDYNLEEAKIYFDKALSLAPNYRAYNYRIQIAIIENDLLKIDELLKSAKSNLHPDYLYDSLLLLIEENSSENLPADIKY